MPLSIYRVLKLGEMKSTMISLQLADRSITYPLGIVEDVLVKVDKFIFQADFVILDIEADHGAPLIFGRPFLATADAKIDVKKGEISMDVEYERVMFNLFMKPPPPIEELCLLEPAVKLEGCQRVEVVVDSSKEKAPNLPPKKAMKKRTKI
ncbi:uncharacterized protein [Henckelia pumila]|uniref:uncharacterized protein n=1 Tax=Henckelia pumila TaxID=405737 RepID=UPI003C6DF7AD